MIFFVGFLFSFFSLFLDSDSVASAEVMVPEQNTYRSGRDLCERELASMVQHENGFYTAVPLAYSAPVEPSGKEENKTDIYAYFAEPFDPKKNTLIYFNGGPGAPIHASGFQTSMGFNILMIEQRGNACSRPRTWAQYLDPNFYSSEFVARDAEQIRQSLKLDKVTALDAEGSRDCQKLRATEPRTYQAINYPVLVPTTYFQGAHDAATVASEAIAHYRSVAKGPRQMLLLERGGHSPNLTALGLIDGGQAEIFGFAFDGKKITAQALDFAEKNQPLRWQYTHSGF